MKNAAASFLVGLIFAIGLGLSGMIRPEKVIGFLDIFGNWDPSLMFVMIGAISVHFVSYKLVRKMNSPLFDTQWHVPTKTEITPALVIGSMMFGIGWALAGYCPGPAITSLAGFKTGPIIFVVSMLGGMFLFNIIDKKIKLQK